MERGKIVKSKGIARGKWMLLTLLFIGIPSFVHADIGDFLLKFYPYITAQEEYSNNIFLSPNRFKLDDYITTVTPGLRFITLQPGAYGIDLDVSGGYTYYAKHSDLSYWPAQGRLDSWYALTQKLTFRLRDYLVRSDQAREDVYSSSVQYDAEGQYVGNTQPDRYLLSAARGVHAIYFRNVAEPSVEYRFGSENLLSLLYRNNIYRNQSRLYEDSMENTLNPRFTYWFDIRNGVSLDYYITLNTYETSPDQLVNGVTPRYTYRFSPRTSIFGEFHFEYQHFEHSEGDYFVYNPSLGIQYGFSPTLVGTAEGGWWWEVPKEGSTEQGPFFRLSLTQRTAKTLYTLSVEGGYREDYVTAQNRGFTETYSGYATILHQFTPRLSGALTGYVGGYKYSDPPEKAWEYIVTVTPSYLLFRWLAVSLDGSYRQNTSNISANNYSEFRGIFRITLARPGYTPGFTGAGRMTY